MQSPRTAVSLADTTDTAALLAIAAHALIEPILMLTSFNRFANDLALCRGLDPDKPPFLAKITQTV